MPCYCSQLYRSSSFNSSGRGSICDTADDVYSDVSLEDDVIELNQRVSFTSCRPSTYIYLSLSLFLFSVAFRTARTRAFSIRPIRPVTHGHTACNPARMSGSSYLKKKVDVHLRIYLLSRRMEIAAVWTLLFAIALMKSFLFAHMGTNSSELAWLALKCILFRKLRRTDHVYMTKRFLK